MGRNLDYLKCHRYLNPDTPLVITLVKPVLTLLRAVIIACHH